MGAMGGRHKAGVPVEPRAEERGTEFMGTYTEESAAEQLGLELAALLELIRSHQVTYADLGPGEDEHGVWHEHLYRWSPAMLEEVRAELEALEP